MNNTELPDVTRQVDALALKYSLKAESVMTLYKDNLPKLGQFISYEEFLALIIFGFDYLSKLGEAKNLSEEAKVAQLQFLFTATATTVNDPAKLKDLNIAGLTGICDFNKADSPTRIAIVVNIIGSRELFDFLLSLANDQENENTSFFVSVIKFLITMPAAK
jgi:hypothetical protein